MSLKDKLEIGLKPDAPYRPDNLPEFQQDDPACEVASTPGTSAGVEKAREDCDDTPAPRRVAAKLKARRREVTRRVSAAARPAAARRRVTKARPTARPKKARSRR
jgi:hypothetical protein